jgi:hypothetical protein
VISNEHRWPVATGHVFHLLGGKLKKLLLCVCVWVKVECVHYSGISPPTATYAADRYTFSVPYVSCCVVHLAPSERGAQEQWHVCCRGAASFGAAWTRVSGLKQNVVSQIAIAILQFKAMSGWSDDEDDIPCPSSGVSRACCDPFVFVVSFLS